MTRSWITAQEGKMVYIKHRIPEPAYRERGERGVRGIVFKGDCHYVNVLLDYRNDPTIVLQQIDENLILDLNVIPKHELGVLEEKIVEYCRAHLDGKGKINVLIDVPINFSRYQP